MATGSEPSLSDRVEKLEATVLHIKIGIAAVLAVFTALGLAGAVGWSMLTSASTSLATLSAAIAQQKEIANGNKDEIKRTADKAVRDAIAENSIGMRVAAMEKRSEKIGELGNAADSRAPIGNGNGQIVDALCEKGYVAQGIRLYLGGTCNNKCDGDGRPVARYQLYCVKQ